MTDIVERLRHKSAVVPSDNTLCDEAADEIEWLRGLLRDVQKDVMRLNKQVSTFGIAASICQKIEDGLAGTAVQPTACQHDWYQKPGDANSWCRKCGAFPRPTADNQDAP